MEIKIIPVKLGFVKAFLVKGEKTIIVDAGMKDSLRKIQAAMQANGIKPSDVSLLLLTHSHMDHAGGLAALRDLTGAPVAVHAAEASYLREGRSAPAVLHRKLMKILFGLFRDHAGTGVNPDVLIENRLDLNPYGIDGYVFPTPGHTAGSLTLVTAAGEAITGDLVGGGKLGPAIPGIYSDLGVMKASIAGLAGHPVMKVYTSHAGVYSIGDVLKLTR